MAPPSAEPVREARRLAIVAAPSRPYCSEPVLLGEILIEAGQHTQDTPEVGRLDPGLCLLAALLEVPGQAPVAVRERAERGLDPPPDRQGREAAGGGAAERDLEVDGGPGGRGGRGGGGGGARPAGRWRAGRPRPGPPGRCRSLRP